MKTKILLAFAIFAALTLTGFAGEPYTDTMDTPSELSPFSASMFAVADQSVSGSLSDGWGAGGELAYAFSQSWSLRSAYVYVDGSEVDFDKHTLVGYAQYNVPGNISPYLRAGAGADLVGSEYGFVALAGAGLELALTRSLSGFFGADYVWEETGEDVVRFSTGLSISF